MTHSLPISKWVYVLSAYLYGNLFGFGLFCLGECDVKQPMLIIGLHFALVYFHGQLNMPYELARSPFTAMEGFGLYVPSHPPFLPCNAQGVALDTEIQGTGIYTRREGFYVHCLFIFIEVN